jgi:hypothetical protein
LLYTDVRGERIPKQTSAKATNGKLQVETLRGTAAINRRLIATLIGSLSRSVELLTVGIEHEDGVRDLSDPAYPVLARSAKVNFRVTIAELEALAQGTAEVA